MLDAGAPRPGTMIDGRFEVVSTLGQGGMGTVHVARDLSRGGVEVALKVLRAGLADEAMMARFAREAEVAARVDRGEGVARVHATGRSGSTWWIAQELVVGRDLAAWSRERPRAPAEVAALLARVARTLARCHAAGVVHRDVKPQNVVVRSADDAPVLIDFGVAHDIGASRQLTQTGEVVGTPGFMAPEQVDGRPVDGRTDVHALGCVLFWALAGRPPFEGPIVQALAAVLERDPVWPADAPPALVSVGRRALAKDPAARHPTADALADDLLRAAAAPGDRRAPRRRALAVGLVLGLVLLAVVLRGAGGSSPGEGPPPASGSRSLDGPSRRALDAFERGGDDGPARAALLDAGVAGSEADAQLDRAMARRLAGGRVEPVQLRAYVRERTSLDPDLEGALAAWAGPAMGPALDLAVGGDPQRLAALDELLRPRAALASSAAAAKAAWLAAAAPAKGVARLVEASDEPDAHRKALALEALVARGPSIPQAEARYLASVRDAAAHVRRTATRRQNPEPPDLAVLVLDARLALRGEPASAEAVELANGLADDGPIGRAEVALAKLRNDQVLRLRSIYLIAVGLDDTPLDALRAERPGSAGVAALELMRATDRARARSAGGVNQVAAWARTGALARAFLEAPARDVGREAEVYLLADGLRALSDWSDSEAKAGSERPRPDLLAVIGRAIDRAHELAGEDRRSLVVPLGTSEVSRMRAARNWGGQAAAMEALAQVRRRWSPSDEPWVDAHAELALWPPSLPGDDWTVIASGLDAALRAGPQAGKIAAVRVSLCRMRIGLGDPAATDTLEGVGAASASEVEVLLKTALDQGVARVALAVARRLRPQGAAEDERALRELIRAVEDATRAP